MATIIYQDFDLSFKIHPVRKDLALRTNADAVVQAIVNLIQTNHFETPFHPEIGCNVRKLLFENISEFTARDISRFIEETIKNFEPRAEIHSLAVLANGDEHGYNVTMTLFINTFNSPLTVNFVLERVR